MELTPLAVIGIGLATMFFGYFFGLFEGRGQGRKQHAKEMSTPKPEAPPAPQPVSAPAPSPREKSLLRLSLDANQKPRLEVDDRSVDATAMTADQRKRLIDLMVLMRAWVEPAPSTRAAAASTAPPPVSSGTAAGAATPGPTAAARPSADPAAPTTMVGQIDAILQSHLAGTPLAGRAIRIAESREGGATIHVGAQTYSGVADVPDGDVQAAIRAAIAEWEAKYTPS